jgi:hypothetical protein
MSSYMARIDRTGCLVNRRNSETEISSWSWSHAGSSAYPMTAGRSSLYSRVLVCDVNMTGLHDYYDRSRHTGTGTTVTFPGYDAL